MASIVCFVTVTAATTSSFAQQTNIIPFGSEWDYLFTAVDRLATNPFENSDGVDFSQWAQPSFDMPSMTTDGRVLTWGTGPAPFGFGESNLATDFGDVPNTSERDATHYFRHEFSVSSAYDSLTISAILDDGAVIYLDGQRITGLDSCCKTPLDTVPTANRSKNYDVVTGLATDGSGTQLFDPSQPVPYRERAWNANGPCKREGVPFEQEVSVSLSPGNHVLAASVHAISPNSNDMRFDLRLFENVVNEYQGDPSNNGNSFSGEWGESGCGEANPSWAAGSAPGGAGAVARLLGTPSRDTTIYSDTNKTLGTIIFDNNNTYAIAGNGTFSFASADDGNALIDVIDGDHEFQTVVSLDSNLDVNVAAGTSIEFNNDLMLNGNSLTVGGGGGAVEINNNLFTDGGSVNAAAGAVLGTGPIHGDFLNSGGVVAPGNGVGVLTINGDYRSSGRDSVIQIELAADRHDIIQVTGDAELSGELEVTLADGFVPVAGTEIQFLEAGNVTGSIDQVTLPQLDGGLAWDASRASSGFLMVVPEPSAAIMLILGGFGFSLLRRRS